MDNTILCYINMFSLNQQIVIDGETRFIPLDDIVKALPALCYEFNLNKIHLFGLEEFVLQLATELSLEHSQLEIEVN